MTEKTILVFYMNTTGGDPNDFKVLAQEIASHVREDDIIPFFIPTKEENRIECINPRLVGKKQYKEVEALISDLNDMMEEKMKDQ
jgi:hypothetical protein